MPDSMSRKAGSEYALAIQSLEAAAADRGEPSGPGSPAMAAGEQGSSCQQHDQPEQAPETTAAT